MFGSLAAGQKGLSIGNYREPFADELGQKAPETVKNIFMD